MIQRLIIKKLHKHFNYDINFNSDLTFLYGKNGSGKTTILNILTNIIRGEIYKVAAYDFQEILLEYDDGENRNILKIHQNSSKMYLNFQNKDIKLKSFSPDKYRMVYECTDDDMLYSRFKELRHMDYRDDLFFEDEIENRHVFRNIAKMFNCLYLPLDRSYNSSLYKKHRMRTSKHDEEKIDSLEGVKNTIREDSYMVSEENSKIMEFFRNEILKSYFDLKEYNFEDLMSTIRKRNMNVIEIENIHKKYNEILDDLEIKLSRGEENAQNNFFNNLSRDLDLKNDKEDKYENEGVDFFLFLRMQEISRMEKIIKLSNEVEKSKKKASKHIDTYLNIINRFLYTSCIPKKAYIENGNLIFKSFDDKKELQIEHLSSGEKQLVVFFANLVFGFKNIENGIFIVDEPELSLHLSWQRMYMEEILNLNHDIQIIFATHAPELIGSRRNKMVLLEPKL